jgi:hypothetical protein
MDIPPAAITIISKPPTSTNTVPWRDRSPASVLAPKPGPMARQ